VRALVIGINKYEPPRFDGRQIVEPGSGPGALENAISDARAVHESISALPGAASTLLLDCTKTELEQALKDFRDSSGACKDRGMKVTRQRDQKNEANTLGIVYFAGHGINLNNANYLLPVDWRVPNANKDVRVMDEDAADSCVGLDAIEKILSKTDMFAGAVILDCCRDVPNFKLLADEEAFKSRGLGRASLTMPSGMGEMSYKKGERALEHLLFMFATAAGKTARDKSTRLPNHSPFTAALLKAFSTPGLPLRQLSEMIVDEVKADSGGEQLPWHSGSFGSTAGGATLL
jgi:hypothetical protein